MRSELIIYDPAFGGTDKDKDRPTARLHTEPPDRNITLYSAQRQMHESVSEHEALKCAGFVSESAELKASDPEVPETSHKKQTPNLSSASTESICQEATPVPQL